MELWTCCSLLIVSLMATYMETISASPHYCPSVYYVTEVRHQTRYRNCGWWWGWSSCSYTHSYNAVAKRSNAKACCLGWSGTACDEAKCSKACENGGTCTRPEICQCTNQYTGSRCQIPICTPACVSGGTCTRPNICHCPPPFTGGFCESAICNPACRNGGRCAALGSTGVCHCTSNHDGPACELVKPAACQPPCQNGGTCTASGNNFVCKCNVALYTGPQCQNPVCHPGCMNGGTCITPGVCRCADKYDGLRCQTAICNPSCLNGGTCSTPDKCTCPFGRGGDSCETSICSHPCKNEGYCLSPDKCQCPIEYVGPTCEKVKCIPPCRNGGICVGPYNCSCLTGFEGYECGTAVCNPACENGGTCDINHRCVCGPYFNGDRCETADRTTFASAISGIVIGTLALIGLVVIIVLMIRRHRQHKPMVPEPIIRVKNNLTRHAREITHRFSRADDLEFDGDLKSRRTRGYNNAAYDDDGLYMDDTEMSKSAPWKYTSDKVTLGKTIAVGQLAVIKRATLEVRNGMQNVAAKLLKDGASEEDERLMKAKMNFLATVLTPHVNVLGFVGVIAEENMILLELCDVKLEDWLKTLDSVSEEDHDNMIHFTMDIANGMEHLTKNKIVHGRLGVRNILLKEGNNRPLCKITGFGPRKSDIDEETGKSRIPLKSMAPEQIGIGPGTKRVYNEKTDVWTFGITVWEIFSRGAKPYNKFESNQLKDVLETGYRLERPDECPEAMYEIVGRCWLKKPKARPSFKTIRSSLQEDFSEGISGGYYADLSALAEKESDVYDDVC